MQANSRCKNPLEDMFYHIFIILFLCIFAVSVEAGESGESPPEALLEPANDCIFARSVRDYTPLDRSHLILRGPSRKRAYLVTVTGAATSLRTDWRIAFRTRDTRLCPWGGDAILVDDPVQRELRIASIREITDRDVDTLMVHFGRREADEQKAPEPADVPEAGVEELDRPIPSPH